MGLVAPFLVGGNMEYSPIKMQEKLKKYNFDFKKMYGQNFIIDENIINSIITKSQIDKDTLVIEIGPGAGSLTYKLAEKAKNVICYEIDTKLKDILEDSLNCYNNVEIIFEDFLKANVVSKIKQYNYKKIYVVANLPYYITTPIIVKIIEDKIDIDKIVVMVQKEVGERFRATPGNKNYGSLSVYLNYYFNVRKIMDISRNIFIPKPNVDSIVVELNKKPSIKFVKNEDLFFKLIRDSFKQKRKTLKNNLKDYDLDKINKVLNKYNMDLSIRAEQISIEIFIEIANNL